MRNVAMLAALLAAGCAGVRAPTPPAVVKPAVAADAPPAGGQYLYGSGEAAAASRQAYAVLLDHVRRALASGRPATSVVLDDGATLAAPRFRACAGRPPAAVFDMDETAVLNLGYEREELRTGTGFDQQRWNRWETSDGGAIVAVPGAADAFAALRAMGVTVIVNTNRNASAATQSAATLAGAGLGGFVHGETLWLRGDADGAGGKDGRRAAIAARWCVVAMAGDQLGDFTDLFAGVPVPARRRAADGGALAGMWGRGWFVLPNPVYGSSVRGTWDEVFPADRRWTDPGATKPR